MLVRCAHSPLKSINLFIPARQLKPYVARGAYVDRKEQHGVFKKMPGPGLTPEHFLESARKYHLAKIEAAREKQRSLLVEKTETLTGVLDAAA